MADQKLELRIVTPEKPIYTGAVDEVVCPAHDGEIGILPRHARLLASLGLGELRARSGTTVHRFFVEGGFVQVRQDLVTVLCDQAAPLEDLDPDQAEAQATQARTEHKPNATQLTRRATVLRRVLKNAKPPAP